MKYGKVRILLGKATIMMLALGLASISFASSPTEEHKQMEHESVMKAVENFYSALNLMFKGEGDPIKNTWSHAEDITYMGPSGEYLIGWAEIEKEWDKQTAAKLGGRVLPEKIHTVVNGNMAFLNCIEVGQNIVDDKVEPVRLRSSTIFRKEDGVWKVVAHQTDLLGYMTAPN